MDAAKTRIALFAGSFDPFTIGHKSIVDRALGLFDKIIIGIGVNTAKQPWMPLDERIAAIRKLYADEPKVAVESFTGLATDFARSRFASYLLRGVRSVSDFEYETTMADANRMITQPNPIETIYLPTLPELAAVSSSLVRELAHFGAPYKQFIP
jgi:pantetheine-phosphate adenylyltransferase